MVWMMMSDYNDGRFPGGPTTPQTKLDRMAHKCEKLWNGSVDYRHPSTRFHGQSQSKMMLETTNSARRNRLDEIGFGLVTTINWNYTDIPLCFAVAERFWPRTCTFHFPIGEMTINLEDIFNITGLPIIGYPLTCEKLKDYSPLIQRCLGKQPDALSSKSGKVPLDWLKTEFGTLPDNARDYEVEYFTRAYLLAMCGHCFFPNSTGTYVSAIYLHFLEDLDNVRNYAWGAAVLAYLFKCLVEFVTNLNSTELRGFAPILQVWSYQHFPHVGRPLIAPNALPFPLLSKYSSTKRRYCQEPVRSMQLYRQEFDLLTYDKVVWAPYCILDDEMKLLFCHRSCIIHLKTITSHPVDRSMRQFRYVQDIPGDPIYWCNSILRSASKKELIDATNAWNKKHDPQYHVQGNDIVDNMPGVMYGATKIYLEWYGIPRMYNTGLKLEEPRYTPRGYGDDVATILWKRCQDQAGQIDALCNQLDSTMGNVTNYLQNISHELRSPISNTQWPLTQSEGVIGTRVMNWQYVSTNEEEPYVPQFDDGDGAGDEGDGGNDMESDVGFSTCDIGSSSHSPMPHTPVISTPLWASMEPTQEVMHHRRSKRDVPHIHTSILLCPYCSARKRCPTHGP